VKKIKTLKAFHGKKTVKDFYVKRMKAHIEADELIRGTGFDGHRGCAVGCTLNRYDHSGFVSELGIPEWLAYLEDRIFENCTASRARTWPLEFLETINVGANLDRIRPKFMIFVLDRSLTHFDHDRFPNCKKAIIDVQNLYKAKRKVGIEEWSAAADAARWSARRPPAVGAAATAADAAAAAATVAADARWSPAGGAVVAGGARWSADARKEEYDVFADKILELFRKCKR
jgi:hypothetical protein